MKPWTRGITLLDKNPLLGKAKLRREISDGKKIKFLANPS
jgi:hypothetical protein